MCNENTTGIDQILPNTQQLGGNLSIQHFVQIGDNDFSYQSYSKEVLAHE